MKKTLPIFVIIMICALIGFFIMKDKETNLGGATNVVNSITATATSTGSFDATYAVQILERDPNRRYAYIQNNSDAEVYLFFTQTELSMLGTGVNSITSTIETLNGIKLAAEGTIGDTYTINNDNLFYGYIYASSTAVSKEIIVNYK